MIQATEPNSSLFRIAEWNSDLMKPKLNHILELVKDEVKNPRSQVSKAAVQV